MWNKKIDLYKTTVLIKLTENTTSEIAYFSICTISIQQSVQTRKSDYIISTKYVNCNMGSCINKLSILTYRNVLLFIGVSGLSDELTLAVECQSCPP